MMTPAGKILSRPSTVLASRCGKATVGVKQHVKQHVQEHVKQHGARTLRMAAASTSPEAGVDQMSTDDLKAALLDSFWGTGRGLSASSETRAEINELITQLEAVTPCPNPTEAMDMLDGTWKLVYTSNSELMALLALGKLPLLTIEDITQTVSSYSSTVVNSLAISSPLSRTAFSTKASVEVRSPKRLQLRFEQGTISTPELFTDADLPDSVSVMGQTIDLTSAKSALSPVRSAGQNIAVQLANLISQQPDLNIPIRNERAQTWLLTTFLDDTLRINRGDGGSVFVLVKDATAGTSSYSSYSAAYTPTSQMTDTAAFGEDPSMAGAEAAADEDAGPQGASMEANFEPLGIKFSASIGDEEAGSEGKSEDRDGSGFEASIEPLGLNVKASVEGSDDAEQTAGGSKKEKSSGDKEDDVASIKANVEPLGMNFEASVSQDDDKDASKDTKQNNSETSSSKDGDDVASFEASVEPLGVNVKASVTDDGDKDASKKSSTGNQAK